MVIVELLLCNFSGSGSDNIKDLSEIEQSLKRSSGSYKVLKILTMISTMWSDNNLSMPFSPVILT